MRHKGGSRDDRVRAYWTDSSKMVSRTIDDGKQVLQAVTSVRVVMEKCLMCHPNYENVPKGQPIGAITYEFPLK